MRQPLSRRRAIAPLVGLLWGCGAAPRPAPPACQAGAQQVAVIVRLQGRMPPGAFAAEPPRLRRAHLAAALAEHAERSQGALRAFLRARGATRLTPLPLVNALEARVPGSLLPELERLPGVARVSLDRTMHAPRARYGQGAAPGWNLAAVGAPALWALGLRGAGVVVANMDTGVDLEHPDLKGRWRGGANSWFDPFDHSGAPTDPIGHGTQTMGLLAGGDGSGSPLGVAPDATWIAARIYDAAGQTRTGVLHQAFGWLLDPDGDPATLDAPDVVSASWGDGTAGVCDPEFQDDLAALRAAGILVVFAAGNDGPAGPSSVSPANNPGAFSAGAVDDGEAVAGFSGRGPSACTGAVYPDLVAPGVDVRTADLSFAGTPQYATVSGTSYAAPQVAGAAALLLGARPGLTPAELEGLLRRSARDLGPPGADGSYGYGLLDVSAAYAALSGGPASPPTVEPSQLPVAQLDTPYQQALSLSGAVAPRWAVAAGALPAGIALDAATGTLSGTPTERGLFQFTLQVDAPSQPSLLQPETLAVVAPPGAALLGCGPR